MKRLLLASAVLCVLGPAQHRGEAAPAGSPPSSEETMAAVYREASRQIQARHGPTEAKKTLAGYLSDEKDISFRVEVKALPPERFESIIRQRLPDAFYVISPPADPSPGEYWVDIYPALTKREMWIQATPWKHAIFLVQGEWAITSSRDPNPMIATYDLQQTCRALILYDPDAKIAGFAHIDGLGEDEPIYHALLDKLQRMGARRFLLAYSPNMGEATLRAIKKDLGAKLAAESRLVTSTVLFDARTGRWSTLDLGTLLQAASNNYNLEQRERRVQQRRDHNIRYQFPVYLADR